LLVDRAGALKIGDFGLARAFVIPLRIYTHEVRVRGSAADESSVECLCAHLRLCARAPRPLALARRRAARGRSRPNARRAPRPPLPPRRARAQVVTLWYRAPEILLGQRTYTPAVDMWSVGCIFAEMVNRRALWPGDSEIDEIFRIFRTLGTPSEAVWPGVSALPDWKDTFPQWPAKALARVCPGLDAAGLDLMSRMLAYDPAKRISCKDAMDHPFFDSIDKSAV
jgi:serine/threonine protein kinase